MTEKREQEHITKEIFDCWRQGNMTESQEEAFLRHTGTCTFCAERFGEWMNEMLVEPPAYLKEEISRRTRQLDVQTVVKVKQTSKQMQLLMYSLRVGLAVAASIFLLTVTTGVGKMNVEIPQNKQEVTENRQDVTENRQEVTENRQERESITDKLNRGSSYVTDVLNQMTSGFF